MAHDNITGSSQMQRCITIQMSVHLSSSEIKEKQLEILPEHFFDINLHTDFPAASADWWNEFWSQLLQQTLIYYSNLCSYFIFFISM